MRGHGLGRKKPNNHEFASGDLGIFDESGSGQLKACTWQPREKTLKQLQNNYNEVSRKMSRRQPAGAFWCSGRVPPAPVLSPKGERLLS